MITTNIINEVRKHRHAGVGIQAKMSVTNSSPLEVAKAASTASRNLAILPAYARNDALTAIHQALADAKEEILAANARDVELATKAAEDGRLSQSVLKRLDLARKGKWEDMLKGILDVRDLEDPGERPKVSKDLSWWVACLVLRGVWYGIPSNPGWQGLRIEPQRILR